MRFIACFMLVLGFSVPALADDEGIPPVIYPALPAAALDAAGFAPAGWVVEETASGDLNADGMDDLVLVLHDKDPANVVTALTSDAQPYDTNPRLLAVAFGEKPGGYRLALQDHTLIPRPDNPGQEDVMENGGIAVERGSLVVSLSLFMNAGGSDAGRTSYRFRYRDGNFRLIGYDRFTVNRMSGATEDLSVNFLNGKVIIKTGSIESDAEKAVTRRLKKKVSLTLEDVGNGMMYEPEY